MSLLLCGTAHQLTQIEALEVCFQDCLLDSLPHALVNLVLRAFVFLAEDNGQLWISGN